MIAMNSYKSILISIGKYIWYTLLFFFSLFVIGVIAGLTYYKLLEYNNEDYDTGFIQGCMSAGLSEEICKGRVY